MSKFFTMVLIPETVEEKEIGDYVFQLLLPHGENYEFPPFRVPCDCLPLHAFGIREANKQVGDFHQLWWSYSRLSKDKQPDWSKYIKPWADTAIKVARSGSPKRPNRRCENCRGSGIRETNSFPGQLYDYWLLADWINLGSVETITNESEFEAVLTPDCIVQYRWRGVSDLGDMQNWNEKVKSILQENQSCIAIKCLMHK